MGKNVSSIMVTVIVSPKYQVIISGRIYMIENTLKDNLTDQLGLCKGISACVPEMINTYSPISPAD